MSWVDGLGYAAALSVLLTFCMSTMIPLRLLAVASNVLFGSYGLIEGIYPVLVLHTVLLPVNLFRLAQIVIHVRGVREATEGGVPVQGLLPLMRKNTYAAGTTLFRKGESADRMYYVGSGTLRIEELGKEIGPGEIIGEIGLFAPDQARTDTIVCTSECELYELGAARAKELYFQNPAFAFAVLRLIVARLLEDRGRTATQTAR